MNIEEQKAHERERIEEAKHRDRAVQPLDTEGDPGLDLSDSSKGTDMAGQVLDTTKYKYPRIKIRCPDGVARYSASSADAVAKRLFGMTKEEMKACALVNGLEHLSIHFDTRNLGHFRMILGQALRSLVVKGTPVTIRKVSIESLSQPVDWPDGYVQEDKGTIQNPVRRQVSANRTDR